ncbi:hypothetical protein [Xanthomonas euvesicatoria]|uniref:Uncharacterized protein n=1 Tax=Xanthomonas euvesicatoria TaxID=456327 RepID=A0AAW3U232_XANEU|nr:hypothetical protein [Xanthomonas euvesicatoria]MBB4722674.1 hypothetical protein [Xanthomonas euvesicatoria]MBB4869267.1 hypothetical protein [Xanthomonas euvesicatoria]
MNVDDLFDYMSQRSAKAGKRALERDKITADVSSRPAAETSKIDLILDSRGRPLVSICEMTGRFNSRLRDTTHDTYDDDEGADQ